jgi:uncharacterized protein (TIGR03085 family)
MPWVETERSSLVETLRSTDPDAPTLCVGWDTRHLLAHLVQREHSPAASVGDVVVKRPPGEEKYLGRLVDGARSPEGYQRLVDRFLAGPPRWSPMSWAGESFNLVEYVIHHEDVRRGSGSRTPRALPADQERAVWDKLKLFGRLSYRKSPVGVTLALPDGTRSVVKLADQSVVLTGAPVELALYVSGRRQAAAVEVTGPPETLAQFEAWAAAG